MNERISAELLQALIVTIGNLFIPSAHVTGLADSLKSILPQIHQLHEAPLSDVEPMFVVDLAGERR